MGREARRFTLEAAVSRHNSEQDDIDDETWAHLLSFIRFHIENNHDRYDQIRLTEM
jgi:hypothetical protein